MWCHSPPPLAGDPPGGAEGACAPGRRGRGGHGSAWPATVPSASISGPRRSRAETRRPRALQREGHDPEQSPEVRSRLPRALTAPRTWGPVGGWARRGHRVKGQLSTFPLAGNRLLFLFSLREEDSVVGVRGASALCEAMAVPRALPPT